MFEIQLATTAAELSEFFKNQNNAILSEFLNPTLTIFKSGFYEDPHGQTVFIDHQGNTTNIHSPDEINGWTV